MSLAIIDENQESVKSLIKQKADVNAFDNYFMNPLAYAVDVQNQNLINILFKAGVNPYARILEGEQENIVRYAKSEEGEDTPCSRDLEKRMRLDEDYFNGMAKEFSAMLQQHMIIAEKEGKKILIILGESHGHYKIEQMEKLMIRIAKKLGIEMVYAELPPDESLAPYPVFHYAKNKMKMNVLGIDEHPRRDDEATSPLERSIVMSQVIHQRDQPAVFITGCYHLQHYVDNKSSQIDRDQFHIIPINLIALAGEHEFVAKDMSVEAQFSIDPKKVIQVDSMGMSPYDDVLHPLNAPKFLLPRLHKVIKDPRKKIKVLTTPIPRVSVSILVPSVRDPAPIIHSYPAALMPESDAAQCASITRQKGAVL